MARSVEEIEADREAVKARLDELDTEMESADAVALIAQAKASDFVLPDASVVHEWFLTAIGRALRNADDYQECDYTLGRMSAEFDDIDFHIQVQIPLVPIEEDDAEAA